MITSAVEPDAKPPERLRVYLYTALSPGSEGGHDVKLEKWTARHGLALGELDRDRIADIDRKLGLKLDGSPNLGDTLGDVRPVAR